MFIKSLIKNTILQKYVMEEENRVNDNFRLLYMMEYRGGYVRKILQIIGPIKKYY